MTATITPIAPVSGEQSRRERLIYSVAAIADVLDNERAQGHTGDEPYALKSETVTALTFLLKELTDELRGSL